MEKKKLKYHSNIYIIKDVNKMPNAELARWFGFLNFIKFTDMICKRKGFKFNANKWNMNDVLQYIDDTSGDIEYMLKKHKGIPRKYSLNTNDEESNNIEEIDYE